jgi:hypothetical protein
MVDFSLLIILASMIAGTTSAEDGSAEDAHLHIKESQESMDTHSEIAGDLDCCSFHCCIKALALSVS